ncbi:exodeoxyribonuclease VII, large subunit [Shewanella halifaxensis HAW-EB4]|uniref:Exodeoxyribonuclease 7 large subunit n=1 Tax=Shewanella halifaxensis (strain HAW-EB4) TaxID=458817 RepID=EX7L_SHEHH|nr:exodeoxyribonuclease VII large subunit [Shewanella halifaxensis]B0TLJ2.1 RecName: Full=Exodeoxyribonuclease 7 large subunit; AltName: Full=Exodeoxyribonuclease VII large subunit; Short=Exonuclease VII large subunit [Shewanella halifaxensis HAW-EB4]ABZ75942.1 exodeoxyribonuclease VII, large subunit [Shewanella halifaxensis HAW-EB4]
MKTPKNDVYTVSRLNGEVRQLLEGQLGRIWLNAEISNFAAPGSGHWYLTLKDNFSQIRCAMFKGRNQAVTFRPANGQQVLVKGNISVYEPRGDYQLLIESMLPAGDGLLAQQYEALKMKLAAEGLFASDTKRSLPANIQRIGVVTSPTGAAIRDILHVLARRDASIEVIIYPTPVQGTDAAKSICDAINLANSRREVDVLLVTRGGGSLEDLWSFNDEGLAHTLYNSGIPVVSAVGHEVDMTISDYVADLRAPTPSAGAELLSKDADNKAQKLLSQLSRLKQSWQHYQLKKQNQLQACEHRLQKQDPQRRLQMYEQSFDEMQLRLQQAMQTKLHAYTLKQQNLSSRLASQSPQHRLDLEAQRLSYLSAKLNGAMIDKLKMSEQRLAHRAQQLDTVSPLATLSRGYSITLTGEGKVVQSPSDTCVGDTLTTRLRDGSVTSTVVEVG